MMLGERAIRWFSRGQKVTVAASSESKYVALAKIVNELRFLRQGMHDDVKHHIVRDAVEGDVVRTHKVKSGEQHADVLTKALGVNSFE
ncbi:unnamed protein product, partial [Ascophyllum nodosum]